MERKLGIFSYTKCNPNERPISASTRRSTSGLLFIPLFFSVLHHSDHSVYLYIMLYFNLFALCTFISLVPCINYKQNLIFGTDVK